MTGNMMGTLLVVLGAVLACTPVDDEARKDPQQAVAIDVEGKVDLHGREVVEGGALRFGEELEVALVAESYLELWLTTTASSRVAVDVHGSRDSGCDSECFGCWSVDPVGQVEGPLVGSELGDQVRVVNDDRDSAACDLDPHLEFDVPETGTYRVLIWDYQFRSGTVQVLADCLSGSCTPTCDLECPSGTTCEEGECVPTNPGGDSDGDILVTRLDIDVASLSGRAVIDVIPGPGGRVSFEVGGLDIRAVTGHAGTLEHQIVNDSLVIDVAEASEPVTLTIDYGFEHQVALEGAMETGLTMTWPYYCGNLFPCQSDPSEGTRFELSLSGVPADETSIYPATIPADAPAYMLAWVNGPYRYMEVGTTASGTRVGVYYPMELAVQAMTGTGHLAAAFEWLETVLGPYAYGSEVASVSVVWGPGAYGGMEHHPFWHISQPSLDAEEVHVHEAAHGWIGNSVRIRCWEDFVLSEGTVSYLAARALEAVAGQETGDRVWEDYRRRLDRAQASAQMLIAWPDSCGEVDIIDDGLFSSIPYMKGAFFFRALEGRIGHEALDAALAAFYAEYHGRSAGMEDLLDVIASETGYDPTNCAREWLRNEAIPTTEVCAP